VFVVTPVVVAATPIWAWLAEGHEIVAVIATDELRPSTKSHAAQILGGPADTGSVETAIAASSIRPDTELRGQDRATAQWHFIEYLPSGQRNRICRRGARRGIASQRKSNSMRSGSVKPITTNGSRAAGRPSFVISSIADGESQRPAGQCAVDPSLRPC
jgi:hypothetical protein